VKSVFVTKAYTVKQTVTKAVIPKAQIRILGSNNIQQLARTMDSKIVYVKRKQKQYKECDQDDVLRVTLNT